MRKTYQPPRLTANRLALGVFGDYGGGGDDGSCGQGHGFFWRWWWRWWR